MGRSFSYLGIPPLHVFIGEIVLVAFLLFGPSDGNGRWPWRAFRFAPLLAYRRAFFLLLGFGAFQVCRGISLGHPPLNAIRDFAFNYYSFFFLLGLWIGVQDDTFLSRLFRIAGWVNGLYGILFIVLLSSLPWAFGATREGVADIPVFGQPEYSAAILIGLLSLEDAWRRFWPILLLNGVVLIGMVIRGQWVAFFVALVVWAWVSKNMKKALYGAATVLIPLTIMYATDFSIPGPETRGGTISTRDLVGRAIAPFNPDVAANLTADSQTHEATATFRTVWWLEILNSVHEDKFGTLLGYGYGNHLADIVPYLEYSATRTPNNVVFFALGYTGWIGVAVFAAFQFQLLRMLWIVYKQTGETIGLLVWVAEVTYSLFTPFFEAPYGAIPFYLLVGCACAPLLTSDIQVYGDE